MIHDETETEAMSNERQQYHPILIISLDGEEL